MKPVLPEVRGEENIIKVYKTDALEPLASYQDKKAGEAKPWDNIIKPPSGWAPLDLHELWTYHELLFFLVWRNIKIRYKQTALGAGWAVIQPFLTMVVFSIFFGRLAKIPSDGIPYPIFAYAALVPWTYFSNVLSRASNSLVDNEKMISKVYFPRMFLPAADVLAGLVDFAISFLLLLGMMLWYGVKPSGAIWLAPVLIFLTAVTAMSASLWLSAINVLYRDVRYVVAFLVQFWLFATPVAYPVSLVPERFRAIYGLNPMVGVIEGFRWALLGQKTPVPWTIMAASLAAVTVFFVGGLFYFRRLEETFADVV